MLNMDSNKIRKLSPRNAIPLHLDCHHSSWSLNTALPASGTLDSVSVKQTRDVNKQFIMNLCPGSYTDSAPKLLWYRRGKQKSLTL